MHKSRLGCLVIDCQTDDLHGEAGFWSAALGYTAESASQQTNERYVRLGVGGDDVQVLLQKVDHPARVHLDIETDNIEAEVRRLQAIGAQRLQQVRGFVVMEAPSGHRFCVVAKQRAEFDGKANVWQ